MDFGKIFDTIKGPLLTAASTLIPGGPLILGAINAMLPDDEKLTESATGSDMRNAVNKLSPDQRASLMEKELEVEIADIKSWEGIQASLSKADATGASTRPYIAMMMAWVVTIEVAVIVLAWAYAVIDDRPLMITEINDAWPMLLAIVATPTALLRAYFGMRTKEKTTRYNAAAGQPTSIIGSLIGAFRK